MLEKLFGVYAGIIGGAVGVDAPHSKGWGGGTFEFLWFCMWRIMACSCQSFEFIVRRVETFDVPFFASYVRGIALFIS